MRSTFMDSASMRKRSGTPAGPSTPEIRDPAQRLLIDWLKAGRTRFIGRFLRHVTGLGKADVAARRGQREESAGHAPRSVDPRILDGVFGGFMERVGDGWARGQLPIRAERAASREVSETIYALLERAGGARTPTRPTAVVATVEPDQHVLGSLLVRLMLVQRGWRVEHLGTGLPVAEIVATQQATEASLVCVSFTPPRGTLGCSPIRRCCGPARRPVPTLFAGPWGWRSPGSRSLRM